MAITWSTDAPRRPELPHVPLERLKPSGTIRGAITSQEPLSTHLHFLGGRTLPCTGDPCPGCELQRRRIIEHYISLLVDTPRRHIILAITPGAALNLYDQAPDPHKLRGTIISATRAGKKMNGRVNIHVEEHTVPDSKLPPTPDVIRHLHQIWGITPEQMGTEHPLFAVRESLFLPETNTNGTGKKSPAESDTGS